MNLKIVLPRLFFFLLLTLLTQIGGLIYLFSLSVFIFIKNRFDLKIKPWILKVIIFIFFYSTICFVLIPPMAKQFGRVALPKSKQSNLQPLSSLTFLLNRNYVRSELLVAGLEVADAMNQKFPGTITHYLDGNFPFLNGFPLIPHLSHNDGKKLDLAFCYLIKNSGKECNLSPSIIGYGVCEEPLPNEVNTANFCSEKGYWNYSILEKLVPQNRKNKFLFDPKRTKYLVELFAEQNEVGKIFIEPHLKTRMNLTSDKIRFHGCQAVRHDDHIHVQLK